MKTNLKNDIKRKRIFPTQKEIMSIQNGETKFVDFSHWVTVRYGKYFDGKWRDVEINWMSIGGVDSDKAIEFFNNLSEAIAVAIYIEGIIKDIK